MRSFELRPDIQFQKAALSGTTGSSLARNPKFEIRDPKEIRSQKPEPILRRDEPGRAFSDRRAIPASGFGFRPSFGFREFGIRNSGLVDGPIEGFRGIAIFGSAAAAAGQAHGLTMARAPFEKETAMILTRPIERLSSRGTTGDAPFVFGNCAEGRIAKLEKGSAGLLFISGSVAED